MCAVSCLELMQGLIGSFCGAFKSGLFPDCLGTVGGIAKCLDQCRPCRRNAPASSTICKFCTNTCLYLPLSDMMTFCCSFNFCLSWAQYYKLVLQRPGGMAYAKKDLDAFLNNFIVSLFCQGTYLYPKDRERLQRRFNHYRGEHFINFLSDASFSNAKEAWPYLCRTLQFPQKNIVKCVNDHITCRRSSNACWTKSFIDRLVEIGIPVDRDKFETILDESTDPALSRVRETIANYERLN